MQFLFRSHILRRKKLSACINYNGSSRQDFLLCCLHRSLYLFLQTVFFEYGIYLKFHKISLSVQFFQTVQLVCGLLYMGTDQNDSSVLCVTLQLLSSKKRLVRNPSHYFGESCCCSCHVMLSFFHCKHQCCAENFQICIRYCIDDNFRHILCGHQLLLDSLHIQNIQLVQGNGDTVLFMVLSFCFFLYVFRKIRAFISEGFVPGKFRHTGWNQVVLLFYIMDIVHCVAAAFWKKRADDLTVNSCAPCRSAIVCCRFLWSGCIPVSQSFRQKLCFQRIMTS